MRPRSGQQEERSNVLDLSSQLINVSLGGHAQVIMFSHRVLQSHVRFTVGVFPLLILPSIRMFLKTSIPQLSFRLSEVIVKRVLGLLN